jgi:hypothetical protein
MIFSAGFPGVFYEKRKIKIFGKFKKKSKKPP